MTKPLTEEEALEKIKELIEGSPKAAFFQEEVERRLSECDSLEEKMYMLFKMITTNLNEMRAFYKDLEQMMEKL